MYGQELPDGFQEESGLDLEQCDAYQGPGWVDVDAPLGAPPVFSRGLDRVDLRAVE